MKGRDFTEHPDDAGDEEVVPALNPGDPINIQELIGVARLDKPEENLAERVLGGITYRRALALDSAVATEPPVASRGRFVASGFAVLAVAAGAVLWLRAASAPPRIKITPEQSSATPAANSKPASSTTPPVDPCDERRTAVGAQPLIDDFEDGDDEIARLEDRSGLWRWVRDTDAPGTAPALLPIPRPNAHAGNRLAIHVKGGRLLEWGAVVEFNFVPACYDASVYRGLSFQAKGPGRIFVAPREVGVIPVANGGTCVDDCHNAHVKKVELDSQWKTVEVLWNEVAERGYNKPPLNPSRLNSLAFQIHPEDTPYDLWLDDVRFLKR